MLEIVLLILNKINTNYQNLAKRLTKDIYPFQDNIKWEQKNTCWLRDAYLNIVNQLALSCLKLFLRVILRRCAAEIMGNGIRWEWQIGKCMFYAMQMKLSMIWMLTCQYSKLFFSSNCNRWLQLLQHYTYTTIFDVLMLLQLIIILIIHLS